ncbi:HEPN domain-containing protein [Chlorobium sp. KB01]|uniref:HEPN domain-containing protein n=1 Tax=Chlorobium sp. KB01 TaxID=1917528 RepID=UPI000976C525|nr:HEPN domain-containing protein [Chlorobium sp. KB01]
MESGKEIGYRFELARGFLEEAELDYSLKRWRTCVSHSILVIENTGLAILMLFGVSSLTHKPGLHLSRLISEGTVSEEIAALIEEILPDLQKYDSHLKMLAKYGDEAEFRLPWKIFDEEKGVAAIEAARKCMRVSTEIAELAK